MHTENRDESKRCVREVLDVRGARCPIPLLRTRKVLLDMAPEEELTIIATDPDAGRDMEAFCTGEVCVLVSSTRQGQEFHFVVRRV